MNIQELRDISLFPSMLIHVDFSEIDIQPIDQLDIPKVIDLMNSFPEVAFLEWEDSLLLEKAILDNPHTNFIAKKENEVVGALIGGSFGVRGTISHLVISEKYQSKGIGYSLVNKALLGFKSVGIRRIFLFVLDENIVACKFWKKVGFKPVKGETTFELDL